MEHGWLAQQVAETRRMIATYPKWMRDLMEQDRLMREARREHERHEFPRWLERKFGNY